MTNLCPRCSTPRAGEYPICQVCGLDFRSQVYQVGPAGSAGVGDPGAGAQMPASPYGAPPLQPAPPAAGVCPRCHAPLYPGYTMCGNCGFDSGQPAWGASTYGTVAPTVKPAGSKAPILIALVGVALLAVAGGLVLAVSAKSGSTASPSAPAVALATRTSTPAPTHGLATATPKAKPTVAEGTAEGTAEPSPMSTWTSFTAPDKKWTVQFPSASTPMKQSLPLDSGIVKGDMAMYFVSDSSGAVYAVAFFDFGAGTLPTSANSLLKTMESSMATGMGGTLVSSSDSSLGGNPARDLLIAKSGMNINLRLTFVGDRFYMLMVMGDAAADTYPQHFFDTLTLN